MSTVLTPLKTKTLVNDFLQPLLDQHIADAAAISPYYQTLWQAIKTQYEGGGKRLRPYLVFLSYQAFGGKDIESIVPAAAAQELLHQALLMHDDIIDRDLMRYGKKNVIGQFMDQYKEAVPDDAERLHFAQSAALLAGDLLIPEAYSLITRLEKGSKVHDVLNTVLFEVIGGQLLDTEAVFRHPSQVDPLIVARYKTASYSFIGPLLVGAVLADTTTAQQDIIRQFGATLGIGYQLRDDLIGVFGDSNVSGKSTDSDLQEGKLTSLIKEFYERAADEDQATFKRIFGNSAASRHDLIIAKQLLVQSGAKTAIEQQIDDYKDAASSLLDQLELPKEFHRSFEALIDLSLNRSL